MIKLLQELFIKEYLYNSSENTTVETKAKLLLQ